MDYRPIIESRYNRQNWQTLLHDIFGSRIKFWNTPSAVPANSQFAKQALWLGTITLSDEQTISVYEVELSDSVDIERNRRGIRDMLLTTWRSNGNAGAFMFCYRKNESVLRFSYVSEAWTFADDGTYQKESTDAKRFTYLLGEGHRSRTAIQQFEKLKASSQKLKDLTKAFSVDAVSDMFFDEYKKNYEDIIQFITGKRMVKVNNKWEERVINEPCEEIMQEFANFPNPEKSVRDYVKKLMGRLVFLQYLQKKGWLGVKNGVWGSGDPEFVQNLFLRYADKDHFIDNVLEELFNELNTEHSIEQSQFKVPYLNGGLFEREATDETEFPLPAKYMQQMLDFFASYNFTIDENDPDDAEVGVDPEMLGRIFENLLEDNKDKGAFYTPKEIVTYMCRESLIAYLQTDIEDEETKEAIRQFVTTHDKNDLLPADTDQKLKDVKICDPAIGSGAFPMGLLKELFLCRTALEGIDQSKAAEIKKHIIQNNIYGVDIERGAVDIARLRFWLSLIVDEETPQALPNLDYKIVEGNSLITTFDGRYINLSTNDTDFRRSSLFNIRPEKKALQAEQKRFFTLTGDDKYRSEIAIKNHILNIIWYQLDYEKQSWKKATIEEAGLFGVTESKGRKKNKAQVVEFTQERQEVLDKCEALQVILNDESKPLQERASTIIPFFEWETVFSDVFDDETQKGFNIVIGNPPYVFARNSDEKGMSKDYKELYYKNFVLAKYQINLYHLFVELGVNLLNKKGTFAFIIPNNWMTINTNKDFRKYILMKSSIIITNFYKKVFDNADVDSSILIFNNSTENSLVFLNEAIQVDKIETIARTTKERLLSNKDYIINIELYKSNEFISILDKIETCSCMLSCLSDVKAGLQAYEVGKGVPIQTEEMKKARVYHSLYKVDDSYYPYIDGNDVKRYELTWERKEYLKYGDNLAAPRKNWSLYSSPRILVRQIPSKLPYCINACFTDEVILNDRNSMNIINISCNPLFLLAVLNSRPISFWFAHKFGKLQRGLFPQFKINELASFPIPSCESEQEKQLASLAKRIMNIKKDEINACTGSIETKIDNIVYQLYGISEKEIQIIEQSIINNGE